jgi:outer membrane beta-barrel protein
MNKARLKLLLVAALTALPATALAQGKKPPPKPAAGEVEDLGGDDTPAAKPDKGDKGGKGSKSDDTGVGAGGLGGDSGANFICEANPEACQTDKLIKDYSAAELKDSQVYAVQQIYALRRGRIELMPYWSVSLNDQFVSHPAPGIAVNYYVTNVLAVGLNFNYYQPFNSIADFNAEVRRSTRLAVPINEYQFNAALNFTYVPLYGKFAGFGDFIFHWDAFVVGGVGAISTRPYAVIDPEDRAFKFQTHVAFNAGLGLRVFINRWLGAFLEVRDYIYSEPLESLTVAKPPVTPSNTAGTSRDPSTWLGDSSLTNAVQAQFGLTFFLPPTFTYRLPK